MWLYEWGYAIFIFLSSFMTYHRVYSKSDSIGVCGWGSANLSGSPEFTPSCKRGSYCSIFSFLCNALWIVVCPFSFGHCVVCPSIYGFWLPLLQFSSTSYNTVDHTIANIRSFASSVLCRVVTFPFCQFFFNRVNIYPCSY